MLGFGKLHTGLEPHQELRFLAIHNSASTYRALNAMAGLTLGADPTLCNPVSAESCWTVQRIWLISLIMISYSLDWAQGSSLLDSL